MPIDLTDINFHHLTRSEAQQIESELDGMYPTLNPTPIQSTASSTFFENHKYMAVGLGLFVVGTYYLHTKQVNKLARDFNNPE